MSVSLDAATGYPITDHGLMVDQDGRKVWRMPGMTTDGQGHVYTIGDWWTIPGDLGTLRYDWKRGNEIYEQAAARPILRRRQRPHSRRRRRQHRLR